MTNSCTAESSCSTVSLIEGGDFIPGNNFIARDDKLSNLGINALIDGDVDLGDGNNSLVNSGVLGSVGSFAVAAGSGNDTISGGGEVDTASYEYAPSAVTVNLALGTASGGDGNDTLIAIENLTGGAGDDVLTGAAGGNQIAGGGGDDVISGLAGDDSLDGGAGIDEAGYAGAASFVYVDLGSGAADFGAGHDTLVAFENILGSSWDDQLIGSAGVNAIAGGGGADTLLGLGGADVLTGAAGGDIFMFNAVLDADNDFATLEEITDFTTGQDVIDLAHIDPDTGTAGDQAFVFIGSAAFTTSAEAQVRFADGILYCDTDRDVGSEMEIALTGVTSLTAADLIL